MASNFNVWIAPLALFILVGLVTQKQYPLGLELQHVNQTSRFAYEIVYFLDIEDNGRRFCI